MRSNPRSWTKTLTALGFRRRVRKGKKHLESGRLSRLESLEARQMLTGTPITVNTLVDEVKVDGFTSLREAISQVTATNNEINFDPSLDGGRIALTEGQLLISQSMTIIGRGADKLAIDGLGALRVFAVTGVSSVVAISDLTVNGGYDAGLGGGIYNAGDLTLSRVAVAGNVAGISGGGVFMLHGGRLTVLSSTVEGNRAGESGGGIGVQVNAAESLKITSSTVSNNTASVGAGVIIVSLHQTPASTGAKLEHATITANTANNGGAGGLYNVHGATIRFFAQDAFRAGFRDNCVALTVETSGPASVAMAIASLQLGLTIAIAKRLKTSGN